MGQSDVSSFGSESHIVIVLNTSDLRLLNPLGVFATGGWGAGASSTFV